MRQLIKYANDLDLFGAKGIKPPPPPPPPPIRKDIGIAINNFSYPDTEIAPSLNYS
jgi:hypothetical protein